MAQLDNPLPLRIGASIATSLDIFMYGFGLRIFPICDLLSLTKVAHEIFSQKNIDEYITQYQDEHKNAIDDAKEVGKGANSLGLSSLLPLGQSFLKKRARRTIGKKILNEEMPRLEKRLQEIGDTAFKTAWHNHYFLSHR